MSASALKSAEPRRLSYVQRVSPKYHYFVYPGARRERLPGREGSPEYIARYNQLLAAAEHRKDVCECPEGERIQVRVAFMPGSVGWVATRFLSHDDFLKGRKPGTQVAYRVMIDILRESDIARGPMAGLKPDHVNHHCNDVERKHGRSRGDYQALILSVIWRFARKRLSKECKLGNLTNPVRERERTYRAKPRLAWPLAVQRRFVNGAPERGVKPLDERDPALLVAYGLLLFTGQRRGDTCAMERDAMWSDAKGRTWIMVEAQEKTSEPVPIRVHRDLMKILAKHSDPKSKFILTTKTGKRYDKGRLTKAIQKRLIAIGEKPSRYTLHGLRKASAVRLAEAGASVPQLMSVFGWKTPTMAMYYVREASKRRLNDDAMSLWENAA
jgi:integrase